MHEEVSSFRLPVASYARTGCVTNLECRGIGYNPSATQATLCHKAAAEDAGHRPKSRPSCISYQPKTGNADVMGNSMLITVGEGLSDTPHSATWAMGEAGISLRRTDLI